ncbi:MAG TPA: isoprenylcysteine carboxylmethyltransferase family protein [Ignavibacteriaceae bacterium]|nr:isoprenylcysteine carboxylmethyltransferase family protein [Ignavibacteriaceae bacterium]
MSNIASKFFKYRSYTPIPFLLLMFFYEDANVWSLILGFIIAVTGELIRLWGVSWAGSETRTTGSVGGTFLVVSGPFARVRNPLYVGNILMYFGLGVMSFSIFPYLQIIALLFFFIQYYSIIKEEEGYLSKTYGKDYQDYLNNVPRFIPRFTRYKASNVEQPPFDLKAGLKSEKRTLQAFTLVSLTIFLLWFFRRM